MSGLKYDSLTQTQPCSESILSSSQASCHSYRWRVGSSRQSSLYNSGWASTKCWSLGCQLAGLQEPCASVEWVVGLVLSFHGHNYLDARTVQCAQSVSSKIVWLRSGHHKLNAHLTPGVPLRPSLTLRAKFHCCIRYSISNLSNPSLSTAYISSVAHPNVVNRRESSASIRWTKSARATSSIQKDPFRSSHLSSSLSSRIQFTQILPNPDPILSDFLTVFFSDFLSSAKTHCGPGLSDSSWRSIPAVVCWWTRLGAAAPWPEMWWCLWRLWSGQMGIPKD